MPVNPTYPGVYIQEVPSGSRTIAGVSTSVTAFIGRARRGPTDEPVAVRSFGEFQRNFGALWIKSPLGYAVQQYFQAGGREALVVRAVGTAVAAEVALASHDVFTVAARTASGNGIGIRIAHLTDEHSFSLEIATVAAPGVAAETYLVSMDPSVTTTGVHWIGSLAAVLDEADSLVRVTSLSLTRPQELPWFLLVDGTTDAPATVSKTSGPLLLTTAVADTGGNDVTVTIAHVSDSDTKYTLVISDPSAAATDPTITVTIDPTEIVASTVYWAGALPAATALRSTTVLPNIRPAAGVTTFSGGLGATFATATLTPERNVVASASSGGAWGNSVRLLVNHTTSDADDPDLFNLTVNEYDANGVVVATESFRNVSMNTAHARYLVTVLDEQSDLLEIAPSTVAFQQHQRLADTGVTEQRLEEGADGDELAEGDLIGDEDDETGMYALEKADIFNLLCLPPPSFEDLTISPGIWAEALAYCADRRAMCLVDAPTSWTTATAAANTTTGIPGLGLTSENGAMYFPWIRVGDPLRENRLGTFAPCGAVAGLIAKTDAQRGIWKAPAGLDARTPIVRGLGVTLSDGDHGSLNPLGLNCLRTFPGVGTVVWGSRTLAGNDRLASDWKYLPVRRLALYIEESLYRGLQWAVFEPNDEPLWGQIRLAAGGFMHQLFRQKAFKGSAAKDAYFVKCDAETTADADIDRGIVNIHIGFAPLKPAEFVVVSIRQIAGQVTA